MGLDRVDRHAEDGGDLVDGTFLEVAQGDAVALADRESPHAGEHGEVVGVASESVGDTVRRIVGIEPARDNAQLARKNTQHNPLIEIVEAAVYARETGLALVDPHAEKFAYRVQEAQAGEQGTIAA
eukprot:gene36011-59042_t